MTTTNRTIGLLIAVLMTVSMAMLAVAAAPRADSLSIGFNIKNTGSHPFWVCKDWSAPYWKNRDNCGPGKTKYRRLRPGQTTYAKFGWGDADGICFSPRLDGREQALRRKLLVGGYRDHSLRLKSGTHRRTKCFKVRPLAGQNGVPKWSNRFRDVLSGPTDITVGSTGGGGGSW